MTDQTTMHYVSAARALAEAERLIDTLPKGVGHDLADTVGLARSALMSLAEGDGILDEVRMAVEIDYLIRDGGVRVDVTLVDEGGRRLFHLWGGDAEKVDLEDKVAALLLPTVHDDEVDWQRIRDDVRPLVG